MDTYGAAARGVLRALRNAGRPTSQLDCRLSAGGAPLRQSLYPVWRPVSSAFDQTEGEAIQVPWRDSHPRPAQADAVTSTLVES